MAVEVTLPNGAKAVHHRPFLFAVAVGPAEPAQFQVAMHAAIAMLEDAHDRMEAACDERVVESVPAEQPRAWLRGWPYYQVDVPPDWNGEPTWPVDAFLYPEGEVETGERPVTTTVVGALVNHVRAEMTRNRLERARVQTALEAVQAGDAGPLGDWRVARWCRDRRMALDAQNDATLAAGPLGCPVALLETRKVQA